MKKLLCVLLCLMLVLPAALADTPAVRLSEDDPLYTCLYERSMELAGLFNEALHNEQYIALYSTPSELQDELTLIRMQDYTQPWSVTIVRADDAMAFYLADDPHMLLEELDLSPALKTLVLQRLYESTGSVLAGQSGTATLALSSVLSFSDAFIQPEEMGGPCFAVMMYGGLYAFLVTFCPTANRVVLANAQFIPSRAADDLNMPIE